MRRGSFRASFRRSVLTGLAGLLPLIVTIVLLSWAWTFINRGVAQPINNGFKALVKTEAGKSFLEHHYGWSREVLNDNAAMDAKLDSSYPKIVGLSIALLLGLLFLYLFGYFLASFIGQRVFRLVEMLLGHFPIVQSIYPYAKRFTSFLFSGEKQKFRRVVAIPYPRQGMYALAFVTSEGFPSLSETLGRKMVNVFLPTSPTPFTGFTLMVAEEEILPLPISVDEAFSFIVSGGVLVPVKDVPGVVLVAGAAGSLRKPPADVTQQDRDRRVPTST